MKRTPVRLYFIFVVLAAMWLAGLHWFTRDMMIFPPAGAERVDAIVALTGGSNRIETAFALLDKKAGRKLFISGVYHGVEVRELMTKWRNEKHDEMDCCVVLGFEADNTMGNAKESIAWLEKEDYHSIYLVTASYHMKRALLAFQRLGPDITIIPYPVTPEGLDMKNWWRNENYRSLIIREYCKYLASIIVYDPPRKRPPEKKQAEKQTEKQADQPEEKTEDKK